jgi:hypothetical protein
MKKSIIIVVIIAILVLGLFIWIGQSKPLDNTLSNLQAEKSASLVKMLDTVLNSATLNIFIAVDDFYQKNTTTLFEKDTASLDKIDSYIAGIKNKQDIDVGYSVYSTKTNFVVKTMEKGGNNFYCLDTVNTESVKPIIIETVADFTKTTDCKGVELK